MYRRVNWVRSDSWQGIALSSAGYAKVAGSSPTEGEDRFCGEPRKGKRIQIGTYAKARAYVKISSYGDAYKMDEKDFERGYYENHLD